MPRLFALALLALAPLSHAADAVRVLRIEPSSYAIARESLAFAIENQGLVVSATSQFGKMLARTAKDLGHRPDLYGDADVLAFCSARVAARLAAEAPSNVALCPLSMSVYTESGRPDVAFIAWRPLPGDSQGARMGNALMEKIGAEVVDAATLAHRDAP